MSINQSTTSQTTTTEHHPALVHHFDSMEQQQAASTFGMWVFLLTEIMMFGGLFTAYLIYRLKYYPAFVAGSTSISVSWGFANTLVLIASSLTMAMSVWAAQKGDRKKTVMFLIFTMILGAAFLGVKAKEYYDKWEECHIPGNVIGKGFNAWGGCDVKNPEAGKYRGRDTQSQSNMAIPMSRKWPLFRLQSRARYFSPSTLP